jgi:tetratricopeptide (TPR) repeat protein
VGRLRVKLTAEQQQRFARQGTSNPEAYGLYVKGLHSEDQTSEQGLREAIDLFRAAIDKDANYAAAYGGTGECYAMLGLLGYAPVDEAYDKAVEASKRAIALDDAVAEAHVGMGLAAMMKWNWSVAGAELQRATQLNPNLSAAHREYAVYLANVGRLTDALVETKTTVEVDPLSLMPHIVSALVYRLDRNYNAALGQANKAVELNPNSPLPHYNLYEIYRDQGMHDQAVSELVKGLDSDGNKEEATEIENAYKRNGYKSMLAELIRLHKNPVKLHDPVAVAEYYVLLGDKDQAFLWLNKAYDARSNLFFLKVDPVFDPIRSDPRFADLLRRMGLPQ